jgi:hypothetical protein
MRRDIVSVVGVAALCGVSPAIPAEVNALVGATIVAAPYIVATESSIRFGSFAATAEGQAVTVHPSGGRTMRGVLPTAMDHARRFGPAGLVVTGERGWTYAIALPASAVVTGGAGSNSLEMLRVTDFQLAPAGGERLPAGSPRLLLGATLTVRGRSLHGSYSGSVAMTVLYD